MRWIVRWVAVVLVLLMVPMLAACRVDEVRSARGEKKPEPDAYADYLAMREASREQAALLVRGLADALHGTVGTIDGDWEGCGQRGEETYAFTYGVTAVVDGARVEEGLPTAERVLHSRGWTTFGSRPYRGDQRVEAARGGIAVVVDQGIPADRLLVRTSGGCFPVPSQHRDDVRQDVGDDRIEVPPSR